MDIYLRRFGEYWNAMFASLRKLESFSMRTSAIFPYAHPQMSAERSAEVCEHLCRHLCGCLCGLPHGWVLMSAEVHMDGYGRPQGQRIC